MFRHLILVHTDVSVLCIKDYTRFTIISIVYDNLIIFRLLHSVDCHLISRNNWSFSLYKYNHFAAFISRKWDGDVVGMGHNKRVPIIQSEPFSFCMCGGSYSARSIFINSIAALETEVPGPKIAATPAL